MPRPTQLIALFGLLLAAGCSSSSSAGGSTDAGTSQDTSCEPLDSSFCGQPCQAGNSLGVGAFCNNITDCSHLSQAHLCASLGDPNAHFCTFRCSAADAGMAEGGEGGIPFPTDCGQGATCTCDNSGNCGCTPDTCLGK